MRWMIAAVLLTLGAGSLAAQTAPEWTGVERDLDSNSARGSATISADKESVALGEAFSVDIRFLNKGASDEFYSPFLGGLTPLPAQLAIFDSDHKFLGTLIERQESPRQKLIAEDWTFIPTLGYVGHAELLTAGYVPRSALGGSRTLPPGEYYVQAIFFKAFLARNPARLERKPLEDEAKMYWEFERNFDRAELFRSNVVKVRFTAK